MWSDPVENLKNENQCKIFNLVIVTSNKLSQIIAFTTCGQTLLKI